MESVIRFINNYKNSVILFGVIIFVIILAVILHYTVFKPPPNASKKSWWYCKGCSNKPSGVNCYHCNQGWQGPYTYQECKTYTGTNDGPCIYFEKQSDCDHLSHPANGTGCN